MPRAAKPTVEPTPETVEPTTEQVEAPTAFQIKGTKDVLRKEKVGKPVVTPKKVTTVSAPHTNVHSVYYS